MYISIANSIGSSSLLGGSGVVPSFALNFATIATDFTFTRNSFATRVNEQGLIETVSSDVPRIDYTNGVGEFLLEPASTNLLPYSEDFSDSDWIKHTGIVLTPNQQSPNGGDNAYKVQGTIGSSYILDGGFGAITPQSRSIYMRADTNGVVYSLGDGQSNQINVTTEWQRYELQEVSNAFYAVDFRGSGVTLDTVYIWGAQAEALPYATSYIPTNGTTVTRAQELCLNATPTINSEEGVLYAEIRSLEEISSSNKYITLSDKTYNNRVSIVYNGGGTNQIRVFLRVGGVVQIDVILNVSNITDINKAAISYKQGELKIYLNGSLFFTNSGSVWAADTLTDLSFSEIGSSSAPFYGRTKDLRIYSESLTDEQLTELTTI